MVSRATNTEMEGSAENYGDYVIQWHDAQYEWNDDEGLSNTGSTAEGYEVDPTGEQLANNELAELVYFDRSAYAGIVSASGANNIESQRWAIATVINGETGFFDDDVSSTENPVFVSRERDRDIDSEMGNAIQFRHRDGKYPELVDFARLEQANPVSSGTDGYAASGDNAFSQRTVDFRSLFGMGPVLDANDHISFQMEVWWNKVDGEYPANGATLDVQTMMVWDIHELDRGRPRFGL